MVERVRWDRRRTLRSLVRRINIGSEAPNVTQVTKTFGGCRCATNPRSLIGMEGEYTVFERSARLLYGESGTCSLCLPNYRVLDSFCG